MRLVKPLVLLTFQDNWVDAMEISSWQVVDKAAWETAKAGFLKAYATASFYVCIGTNGELFYDNAAQFLERVHEADITQSEYEIVTKLFGAGEMNAPVNILRQVCDRSEPSTAG